MFAKIFSSFMIAVASLFGGGAGTDHGTTSPGITIEVVSVAATTTQKGAEVSVKAAPAAHVVAPSASNMPKALSHKELLALAGPIPKSVTLGDDHYTTSGAKKGYVYLCNVRKDNPGSAVNGPWIKGSVWNLNEKVTVDGAISWPNASFSNVVSGSSRTLSGNGLPLSHTTGVFPVSKSDDAALYDPNPNTISSQTLKRVLSANPVYSETPYCMGGEVGVMLSGVPLFNGFDAGLRDAAAHELQDSCDGHPQGSGQYHYHSLSKCFKDISVDTVLGYAFDGFPITGPKVAEGKYLETEDLDICHGLTSEVMIDGKKKITYHYVMTHDFPYSASCFRGKAISSGPSTDKAPTGVSSQAGVGAQPSGAQGASGSAASGRTPPQEAISVCSGKSSESSCSFQTPNGAMNGICRTVPEGVMACVPR